MSIITKLTILDPSASPQTGVGDGDSMITRVGPIDTNRGGAEDLYKVTYSADWTGGVGTLTPSFCNDPGESPRRWVDISKLQDDGTDAALTRTDDFNLVLNLPAGSLVKWTVSGSGSPLPNISMTARGVIRAVG